MTNFWPFIAIVISVISLYIVHKSYSISKNNYFLNLKPIINVYFDIKKYERKYNLIISNDGPNTVYDIHIQSLFRLYNLTKDIITGGSFPGKDWNYVKKLSPSQKRIFPIPYDELYNTYKSELVTKQIESESKFEFQPIHLFYIEFYKKPDRSVFNIKKYLLICQAKFSSDGEEKGSILLPIDFDKTYFHEYINLRRKLEIYDQERLTT